MLFSSPKSNIIMQHNFPIRKPISKVRKGEESENKASAARIL
jgi:hypothetical protein